MIMTTLKSRGQISIYVSRSRRDRLWDKDEVVRFWAFQSWGRVSWSWEGQIFYPCVHTYKCLWATNFGEKSHRGDANFFCGIVRSPKYAQDYRVGCFDVRCQGFALSNELLYMICFHYRWRLMTAKRRYHHDRIPHIRAVNHWNIEQGLFKTAATAQYCHNIVPATTGVACLGRVARA